MIRPLRGRLPGPGARSAALLLLLAAPACKSPGIPSEDPPPLSDRPWVTLRELAERPDLHVAPHQHVIFDLARLPAGAEIAPRTYRVPLYLADSHDLRMRLEEAEPCFSEVSLSLHDGTPIFTIHPGSRSAGAHLRRGHADLVVRLADPLPARCQVAFMSLRKRPARPPVPAAALDSAASSIETAPNLTRAFQIVDPGAGQSLPALGCTGGACPYLLSIDPLPSIATPGSSSVSILGMAKYVPVGDGGYGWSHAAIDPTSTADQFALTPAPGSGGGFQVAAYAGSYSSSGGVAQPLGLVTPDCASSSSQFVCSLPGAPGPPPSALVLGGAGAPTPVVVQATQPSPHLFSFTVPLGSASASAFLAHASYAQTRSPLQTQELLLSTAPSGGSGSYAFQAREVYRMYDQCSAAPQCCGGTCTSPTLQAGEISLSTWVDRSPRVFVFNADAPVPFLSPISNWTLTLGPDTTSAHCYSLPAFQGDVQVPGPGVPCQSLRVFLASQVVFTSDCRSCNLDGADLSGSVFDGHDFSSSTFRKAKLAGSTFRNVDFTGVDASGADLTGAILDGSTWGGTGAFGLLGADLTRASFQRASLRGMQFDATVTFSSTVFDAADLEGARFTDANLDGSSFRWVDFKAVYQQAASQLAFYGTNLPYVRLDGAVLDNMDLAGNNMPGLSAFNTSFRGAYLVDVAMPYAVLKGADFSSADLQGAAMAGSNLFGAVFRGASLNSSPSSGRTANLQGSLLIDADFNSANVSGADFSYSILGSSSQDETCESSASGEPCANFYDALVEATRFDNAWLGHVNFTGSKGSDPSFSDASLIGCNFSGVAYTHEPTTTGGVVEFGSAYLFGTGMGQGGTQLAFADFYGAFLDPSTAAPGTTGFVKVSLDPTRYATFRESAYAGKQLCITTPVTVPQSPPPSDANSTCPDGTGGPCSRATWSSTTDESLPYMANVSVAYGGAVPPSPQAGCSPNADVQLALWNEASLSLTPSSQVTQTLIARTFSDGSSGCLVDLHVKNPQASLSLDRAWPVTYSSCTGPWPMSKTCELMFRTPVTTSTGPLPVTLTDDETFVPIQVSCGMTAAAWSYSGTATPATDTSPAACTFPVTLGSVAGPVGVLETLPAGWSWAQGSCGQATSSCTASVTVPVAQRGPATVSDGISSIPLSFDCEGHLTLSGATSFSGWPSSDGSCHFTVGVETAQGPASLSGGGPLSMGTSTCDGSTFPCSFTLNAPGAYSGYPASVSVTDGTDHVPVSASCGMYLPQGTYYTAQAGSDGTCSWVVPVAYASAPVGLAGFPGVATTSTCTGGRLASCAVTTSPVSRGTINASFFDGYGGKQILARFACQ